MAVNSGSNSYWGRFSEVGSQILPSLSSVFDNIGNLELTPWTLQHRGPALVHTAKSCANELCVFESFIYLTGVTHHCGENFS